MSVESFYDEVVATAVVDFDSPEIQDIISALEELLYRFVNKMTENKETNPGSKVSYIQQCGSIAEKTSLWKSVRRRGKESKFIEFDYLAVMENDGAAFNILEGPCRGCRSVEKDSEQILVSSMNKNYFLDPLYKAITAMCPCTVEHFTNYECLSDISNACLHCKSVSDSGYLQIAKTSDFEHQKIKRSESCSLVFYWTSWTNSLFAPNIETLLQTEKINRLVIRVDFLPAFETKSNSLENASPLTNVKHLIIAKKCRACRNGGWMFSYSMYEVDSILNMKNSHRKCFIIIKFLYSQFIFWADGDQYLKSYYAKVAFLNHCDTCTDIGDSTRCVVDVLQSLLDMYRLKLLKVHISGLELQLPESVIVIEIAAAFMLCFIHILTEMKTYVESKHLKKWCVHGSKGCIAIIKKTVDMLQDGRLWLDTSNDVLTLGKREAAPVPSHQYLRFLLCNRDISLRVTSAAVRSLRPRRLLNEFGITESFTTCEAYRLRCILERLLSISLSDIEDETIKQEVEKFQTQPWIIQRQTFKFETLSQTVTRQSGDESHTCDFPRDVCDINENTSGSILDWLVSFKV